MTSLNSLFISSTSVLLYLFASIPADVTVKEIIALNHGIDPKKVEEKQTILIPGGRLSSRDKEILAGVNLTSAPSDIFSVSQSFSLARI